MGKGARRRSSARARAPKRRRAGTAKPRPTKPRPAPRVAVPLPTAEMLLLTLARDVSARTSSADGGPEVGTVVDVLARAYAPETPLARALREDWLRGRDDKTARLAFAWAREQVRLALVEVLQRARVARGAADADTIAWLWLAASEALAHEPPAAVSDRAHALAAFLSGR